MVCCIWCIHPCEYLVYVCRYKTSFFFEGATKKPQYPSQFSHSSTSIFDTLVVKKLKAVSKSGMYLLIINNNFSTTKWNNSLFLSLSCSASYLTSNNFLVAIYVTNVLTPSPKLSMHSSNCLTILTCIVLSFFYIFIPKRVCLFPLSPYSSPKLFFTSFMISDITSGFLWDNLLSSVCQRMLHCVPSITLFATHIS